MKYRKSATLDVCIEPLCGVEIPEDMLPPVKWFCAKLNMWAMTDEEIAEMRRLNGDCPGCITESHTRNKCQFNPHRRT